MSGFTKILSVFVLLFLSFPSVSPGVLLDRIVALVDREIITWSELYRSMEFELSDRIAGLSPAKRRSLFAKHEREYLNRLIDTKLQLNEARRLNIHATGKEVDSSIRKIRENFKMSEQMFIEALRNQGFTFEEYREKIAEQIIISKLVNMKIRGKIIVTEEDIDRYIKENNYKPDISEGYRIRQIFLKAKTPDERKKAEIKAKEIIDLLDKGESFGDIARRYSDGQNAARGGDLGVIKKKDLAENFLSIIDRLQEGQHSKPFWSDRGLHILYLEEKIDPETAIRDRVHQIILEQKFKSSLRNLLRSLRSNAFIEIKL
jgi:peptidyl-prolyl cis-trans isomerase SurA